MLPHLIARRNMKGIYIADCNPSHSFIPSTELVYWYNVKTDKLYHYWKLAAPTWYLHKSKYSECVIGGFKPYLAEFLSLVREITGYGI